MIPLLKRVTELCLAHNITVNALEVKTGLSHNSIGKWGKSIPSGDRILKVAQFFDVSMDYLMGNTDDPASHKSEPCYDTIGTTLDLQQIKGEIEAQAAALASLVDEKIAKANALGQAPVSEPEK